MGTLASTPIFVVGGGPMGRGHCSESSRLRRSSALGCAAMKLRRNTGVYRDQQPARVVSIRPSAYSTDALARFSLMVVASRAMKTA